jgi:bifunctional non-homologous end joining protein LigD
MLWRSRNPRVRSPRAPAAFIDPCLPTKATKPPNGDAWAHEIKHDGYRLQIHVGSSRVRLLTMTGYDWTDRYPLIVAAATRLKCSAIIDAEAICPGKDGIADFEALQARTRDGEVAAFCFDLMMLDGADLRALPLVERKARLSKLLRRVRSGLHYVEHLEGDGPLIFRARLQAGPRRHRFKAAR